MITLVHLYPRELGINGDVGNVTALRVRAGWRGMPLEVIDVGAGDALPSTAHLVHIGSGPASARQPLHADIARHAKKLRSWADAGVPFLAIAAGWQLLGREVTELDGSVSAGAGVLPSTARVSPERVVGEVAGETELGEVAGFVNFGADDARDAGVAPFARLASGAEDGLIAGGLIGTNLHGPLLPMNPVWADRLLDLAAELAGVTGHEPDARRAEVDDYARRSRDAIRARLGLPALPR
ncbi:MAG: cobyric acid synthase [Schumannella sp.]|nr:cobyric acid synthase [Microbacteriaceae bacterium]